MKKLALCLVALALIASVASAQPYINISKLKGVEVTNKAVAFDGTTGKYVKAAPILFPTILTVATLPTCGSALFGAYASVTDGNGAADCTIGLSTTDVACYCNGTAWTPVGASVDVSGYVLITKAGQQSITASGAGNDITTVSADDEIHTITDDVTFACQDFLPSPTATFAAVVGTNASIVTTAGNVTLTAGGTTQDVEVNSVDDIILTPTDALTANVGGAVSLSAVGDVDLASSGGAITLDATGGTNIGFYAPTSIIADAAGGADELTIATASTTVIGAFKLTGSSAPPVACSGGTAGTIYYDSDINKMCICNGTNYVLLNDDSTTTGCS